jgi:hypothetical protein
VRVNKRPINSRKSINVSLFSSSLRSALYQTIPIIDTQLNGSQQDAKTAQRKKNSLNFIHLAPKHDTDSCFFWWIFESAVNKEIPKINRLTFRWSIFPLCSGEVVMGLGGEEVG